MGAAAIDLSEELAAPVRRPDRSLDASARELIVTELYRRGEISRGKAAQQLGMTLDVSLRPASALDIPYDDSADDSAVEEWEDEKRSIAEIVASLQPSAPPAR